MKGKILSVLFCLMLVFGMIIASCDDGTLPLPPKSTATNLIGEEKSQVGVGLDDLQEWILESF